MSAERGPGGFEFSKQKPPTKIRGSQFVKREEKIRPKLTIRNPFVPKDIGGKKNIPPGPRTP